jgi:cation-transporting ATPase 13A3/4/5
MTIVYFAFYHYMFDTIDESSVVYVSLGLFINNTIPAILPVYLNFAFTILLIRLKNDQIESLKAHKTIESSRVSIVCFDKTGTLTENTVEIQQLLLPVSIDGSSDPQFQGVPIDSLPNQGLLHRLFASCHAVQ